MVNDISKQALSIQGQQLVNNVEVRPIKLEVVKPVVIEGGQEATQQEPISPAVTDTVKRLNEALQSIERDLKFQVDESSGDTIITVLDTKTDEVIRQIPTEDVLAVRENIETLKGILFSAKV